MSISSGNRGIGKSPAISKINRFSPEIESTMISERMRRAVLPKEPHTISPPDKSRDGSDNLWNHSVPLAMNPFYPTIKMKVNAPAARVLSMFKQTTNE